MKRFDHNVIDDFERMNKRLSESRQTSPTQKRFALPSKQF